MINANDVVKNILNRYRDKLKSQVIDEEENKKRLEKYERANSKLVKSEKKVSFSNFDFECEKYYEMMQSYGFRDQGKMNNYISQNNLWNKFPTIRAYNTHGDIGNIKGITPKAYAKVCRLLGRSMSTNGRPLIDSKRY